MHPNQPGAAIEAKIKALFDSAGLSIPLPDVMPELVTTIERHGEDLSNHYEMIQGEFGGPGMDYRHAVGAYCLVRRLASDPTKMAEHLLVQAARLERWATSEEKEAGYLQRCADDWLAKGFGDHAAEYQARADSARRHVAKCRADADAKRARATVLLADRVTV